MAKKLKHDLSNSKHMKIFTPYSSFTCISVFSTLWQDEHDEHEKQWKGQPASGPSCPFIHAYGVCLAP